MIWVVSLLWCNTFCYSAFPTTVCPLYLNLLFICGLCFISLSLAHSKSIHPLVMNNLQVMILSLNITDSLSTAINLLGDYNDCNQNLYFFYVRSWLHGCWELTRNENITLSACGNVRHSCSRYKLYNIKFASKWHSWGRASDLIDKPLIILNFKRRDKK